MRRLVALGIVLTASSCVLAGCSDSTPVTTGVDHGVATHADMVTATDEVTAADVVMAADVVSGVDQVTMLDPKTAATLAVKMVVTTGIDELVTAAQTLQAAAPAPDDDGWNATNDAAAVAAMKQAWKDARDAYERVEGAIAVLFPDLDLSTDERYDGFLSDNGPDTNLFDDMNVTGVHAIERILWSDSIPAQVVAFEMTLTGYEPAAFPSTRQEADDFKNKLCQKLVDDSITMRDEFMPLALDLAAAYRGVEGSLGEQREKITLATTGEDESRYAQHTLADMRSNLAGGVNILNAFAPLIAATPGADALKAQVDAKLASIEMAYMMANSGDALPAVPADWNPDNISAADKATPFGVLFELLNAESDPQQAGSAVDLFNSLGNMIGIPQLN